MFSLLLALPETLQLDTSCICFSQQSKHSWRVVYEVIAPGSHPPPHPHLLHLLFVVFSRFILWHTTQQTGCVALCQPPVCSNSASIATGVTSPAWLGALLTARSLMWMFACTTYRLSVWLNLAELGDRYTKPCCSSHGHLSQDGCRQMDGPVDTNPLCEVMELARVCELLPCHSWLTDWPT